MTVSPTARQKELLVAQRCCADVFKDDAAHPEGRELLASVEAALAEAERHFSEAVGMSGRKDLPAAERQCNEALAVFPGHAGGQALLQEVRGALLSFCWRPLHSPVGAPTKGRGGCSRMTVSPPAEVRAALHAADRAHLVR